MSLIDTSAWIHCLRPEGDPAVRARVQALLDAGEAAWCDMVKLELWNGARGETERRVLREMEEALPLLPSGDGVWQTAFRLARATRQAGKTVPATDLLIAACAQAHGTELVHDDQHLAEIVKLNAKPL
jgi:predicted nucleic acid-binding protein